MNIDNKKIYNKKWQDWQDMKKYGPMSRWTKKLIAKIINDLDYKNVLDVGCGEGSTILKIFHDKNIEVAGADFSRRALEIASEKNPHYSFYYLDITKNNLSEKNFDLVICSEVLEHVEDIDSSIKNLSKLTGQYLVITGPQGQMRKSEKYVGHLRNLDLKYLKQLLDKNDLRIINKYEWGFPFYSPLYRDLIDKFEKFHRSISEGSYNPLQKTIALIIYFIFYFNSYKKGDQLVILAKKLN